MRLQPLYWFVLILSLVFNQAAGSVVMLNLTGQTDSTSPASAAPIHHIHHAGHSIAGDIAGSAADGDTVVSCCHPASAVSCGVSAIAISSVLLHINPRHDAWTLAAEAAFRSRWLDIEPRPPRLNL
ncbi:MAG: hypothetical protein R3F53_00390 [Gammaproteobacteria bacterium]